MITKKFKFLLIPPIIIIVLGVVFGIMNGGLNLGIDFTGGSITTIEVGSEFDDEVISNALKANGVEGAQIVKGGEGYTQSIIRMQDLPDTDPAELSEKIITEIQKTYPNAALDGVDRVGGVSSGDLVRNAFLAVIVACGLMLLYIWIRFELLSGIASIVTLVHDIAVMISIMAIFQLQINSAFIAACLTILGYAINNTIVIFDRIRENLKIKSLKSLSRADLADTSIKQTLTRTINTSITTLIMIVTLYILGVESIKEFSLPIIVGLLAGVYSSVLLAAPFWAILSERMDKKKKQNQKGKAKNGKKKPAKA